MAAEQLNSAISIDKEIHDARARASERLKLGNDIEVPTEKTKTTDSETLYACSSGTENETHKSPCCQENQNNEAVIKEIKSTKYQIALEKTEPVRGPKREHIKQAKVEYFQEKIKETKRPTRTEQYTITEAEYNTNKFNLTETTTGDMEKDIDEITTKLSSVTVSSTPVPENASGNINTEVPKPDESPGSRGDYQLPALKDVKYKRVTSDAIFGGEIMSDVTSAELVKKGSEEADMNSKYNMNQFYINS